MITSNATAPMRSPDEKRRHAARIADWRLRNELRVRIWRAISAKRKGRKIREALERALTRIETRV